MVEGGIISGVNPTKFSPEDPISLFIIQAWIIIVFSRLLNLILSPLKQPRVISEVISGIILGPSVFGKIPGYMETIFPEESKGLLSLVADLGLIYFLFIIGVQMNPRVVMKNARAAISISAGGICISFALGAAVSYGLYTQLTDKTGKFSSFLIFTGVAMSITAFPVLARILLELQVIRSPVGIAALTASVNDDVISWALLALAVSLVNSSNNLTALYIFLLCIGWVLIVVLIVRPILIKLIIKTGSNDNGPTLAMMAITLGMVLISAFVTSVIGVHAVLGGFIMGVIIPHEGGFAVGVTEKIEDIVNILFLPIYFVLSGLKTSLGLLNTGSILWIFIVILCAMAGKIVGCGLMARINKFTWRESLTIGVFMSCKGIIEVVILNIGYDAGVINDRIFVIMIVMTIVTTFLTSPLTSLIYSSEYQEKMEITRGQKPNGDLLHKTDYNKLLVVLNKLEWLPAMMTLVKLLQPLPKRTDRKRIINKNKNNKNKNKNNLNNEEEISLDQTQIGSSTAEHSSDGRQSEEPNTDEQSVVHALRTVALTQRISAVMKLDETEDIILRDPIMNVFRMFGHLNFINIKARLSVVPVQNFAKEVAKGIMDTGSEMVIIPWNGAGAIIDNPTNSEELIGPKERKDTSPRVSNFVQGVFNEVSVSVGFLIDRGLGMEAKKTETAGITSPDGMDMHVFLPFFGGIDDREALSFVVRLLNHPRVTATVIRMRKSGEPTNNDATLKRVNPLATNFNPYGNEPQRPPLAHEMSTASDHVLSSNVERQLSDKADDLLLSEYFKIGGTLAKNHRISYREISSSTVLQTAVERGKEIVTRKDLVIVGRGRSKANVNHREEFVEVLRNLGLSYGNETRKCLGDVAEAFLVGQIASSLFVIQGRKVNNS